MSKVETMSMAQRIAKMQWDGATDEEKTCIRLGMVPLNFWTQVEEALKEYVKEKFGPGLKHWNEIFDADMYSYTIKPEFLKEFTRCHSVALYDCAKQDGGMVA